MDADAGRRYRAYPTPEQAERLTGWGHSCRAVWNMALAQRHFAWQQRGVTIRAVRQCRDLTEARVDLPWLTDLPAQCAQQVLRHLDRAYDNWWNREHPAEAPAFKECGTGLVGIVPRPGCRGAPTVAPLGRGAATETQVGAVPPVALARRHGPQRHGDPRRARLAHFVRRGDRCQVGRAEWPARLPGGLRGCLLGVRLRRDCPAPDGTIHDPGEQRRLLGLERRKARQIGFAKCHTVWRYSRRLRRTIGQIAALEARQARRRLDFTHRLTTDLAQRHGWVGIEDLRVGSMTRSAKGTVEKRGRNIRQKAGLNRAILDNIPAERRRRLAYKAPRFGSELRLVPAPGTSQTCSACGVRDSESRPGCGGVFACTACGHTEHADRNAALNIELAAGQAVDSTRSRPRAARPSSRMREPLGSAA